MLSIYLAGKISKLDWRHSIVSGLRCCRNAGSCADSTVPLWGILENSIFERFDYIGPYFTSCDHGCYHGPNSHGDLLRWDTEGYTKEGYAETDSSPFTSHNQGTDSTKEYRTNLVSRCFRAVQNADLFFAWIDQSTAFGTLVEIGWRMAGDKKTMAICMPKPQPDMWFSYQTATYFNDKCPSPETGLRNALKELGFWKKSYKEYLLSDHWKSVSAECKLRSGKKCQLCNREGVLHVHHRTYERVGKELPEDLICLCGDCHEKFHDKKKKQPEYV